MSVRHIYFELTWSRLPMFACGTAVALQGIDDDSLRTKFLRKTFFRHEINLRECTRIAAGWACLFVVCYAPWFVVLVISYRGRSFCTKGEASYI